MAIIHDLIKNLQIFADDDLLFKAIVGDKDAIPNAVITSSVDYNTGAIANELELLNQFSIDMVRQLNINNFSSVSGLLDDYQSIYNIFKRTDEDDAAFIFRLKLYIIGRKGTKWDIINALLPYALGTPYILEPQDAAYYGISYYNYFKSIPLNGTIYGVPVDPILVTGTIRFDEAAFNLVTLNQSSFENGLAGAATVGDAVISVIQDQDAVFGTRVLRTQTLGTATAEGVQFDYTVQPGRVYRYHFHLRLAPNTVGPVDLKVVVEIRNTISGVISTEEQLFSVDADFFIEQQYADPIPMTGTMDDRADFVRVKIVTDGAQTATFDFDAADLEDDALIGFRPAVAGRASSLVKSVFIEKPAKNLLTVNQSNIETGTAGFTALNAAAISQDLTTFSEGFASLKTITPGAVEKEGVSLTFASDGNGDYVFSFDTRIQTAAGYFIAEALDGATLLAAKKIQVVDTSLFTPRRTLKFTVATHPTTITLKLVNNDAAAGFPGNNAVTFNIDRNQAKQKPYDSPWIVGQSTDTPQSINYSIVKPKEEGSISMWVNLRNTVINRQLLRMYNTTDGVASLNNNVELRTDATGKMIAKIYDATGTPKGKISGVALTANQWTYVAMTWSSDGTIKLFIGVVNNAIEQLTATGAGTGILSIDPNRMYVGSSGLVGSEWEIDGQIDALAIFDNAQPASNLASLFSHGEQLTIDNTISSIALYNSTLGLQIAPIVTFVRAAIYRDSLLSLFFEVYVTDTSGGGSISFYDRSYLTTTPLTNPPLLRSVFAGGETAAAFGNLFLVELINRFRMAGTEYIIYVG